MESAVEELTESSLLETAPMWSGLGLGGPSSLAVVLVSGGMDSCVTAAIARQENDELAFLHVSYGQSTAARERRAFEQLADHFQVTRRLVASLDYLEEIGGLALTDANIPIAK